MIALLALMFLPTPTPAIEFGCFVNAYECGGMEKWPSVVAEMRAAGMTTAVILARSREDLTFQVDTMIDAGMLPREIPMLVIVETSERREPTAPAISGWAVGEMDGQAAVLREAPLKSRHGPARWPELIPYGPDEPGHGDPNADVSGVKLVADGWRALGFRLGTAVEGANVMACIPYLDLIAISASDGYNTGEQVARLRAEGKHFWVYDHALPRECSHDLAFHIGRWCALAPEVYLFWSWGRLIDRPKPELDEWLAAYKAFVEGIPR